MKVFKDCFTNDEVCSDSFDQLSPFDAAELDDVAFEVLSKRVVKGAEDYGIADNSEEDGGMNDQTETVIDVVDIFKLNSTVFSKADFLVYIKTYMGRVKKYLENKKPDRVKPFMDGAKRMVDKLLSNFNDIEFYLGESCDPEAGVVYSYYKDGELTPRFIFFKDGLVEEKY